MKAIKHIAILVAFLFVWACVPETIKQHIPLGDKPGDKLFLKAEKLYETGEYDTAFELYNDYLILYPNQKLSPAAMLKTGHISSAKGDSEKALNIYQTLIDQYPDSFFAMEGMINILVINYNEGNYSQVIQNAEDIDDTKVSNEIVIRKYAIAGDAYLASGNPEEAVDMFTIAYKKAKGHEKNSVFLKLKDSINKADSEDAEILLNRIKGRVPAGSLFYLNCLKYVEEQKFEEAIKSLETFILEYPKHDSVRDAKNLLEEINKKTIYNRYTVGCLLPLSGKYKVFGRRALNGIEYALDRHATINGSKPINLIIRDTGADPIKTDRAVKELAEKNVAAIIGPIFTAETAAKEADARGIPIITLTQKEDIHKIGPYVFRNQLTPEMQVNTIVSYAVETLNINKFAILYPEEKYGTTFLNLFWDKVTDYGGEIVGAESYETSHTDFAKPIKKLVGLYYDVPEDLKETIEQALALATENTEDEPIEEETIEDPDLLTEDPLAEEETEEEGEEEEEEEEKEPEPIVDFDAVFIPDGPEKVGLILPQLVYNGIENVYLLGTNLWHSKRLIHMARPYSQNAIIPELFFEKSDSPVVNDFVTGYGKTFMERPIFIEALSCDTAKILFNLISGKDMKFQASIKEELKKITGFQGLTGITSFDNEGNALKQLYLLKIQGRRFVELDKDQAPINPSE